MQKVSDSEKKRLTFLNVNPINFTQQLLWTNPRWLSQFGQNPQREFVGIKGRKRMWGYLDRE